MLQEWPTNGPPLAWQASGLGLGISPVSVAAGPVKQKDVVYDLGSGDGRIVIAAAKKFGAHAVGDEIDPRLVKLARQSVAESKLDNLVRIEHEDIFTLDLSGADVITLFLYPRLMERLLPQFQKLKPGTRIVSHQFEMARVPLQKTIIVESKEDSEPHRLFLWTAPLVVGKMKRSSPIGPAGPSPSSSITADRCLLRKRILQNLSNLSTHFLR